MKREREKREKEIVGMYFIDRTSCWDMWFSFSVSSMRVHDPTVLLNTEGGETLIHPFINLSLVPHLDSANRQTDFMVLGRRILDITDIARPQDNFLSDMKNVFRKESSDCYKQPAKHVRFSMWQQTAKVPEVRE